MNFIDALIQLKNGFTIESAKLGYTLTLNKETNELEVDMAGGVHWIKPEEFPITAEIMLAEWEIVKHE